MRQNIRQAGFFLTMFMLPLLAAASVYSQETFFKGKTMRIIVGGPPGGGFDTYARMIARHMSRHIPGGPTIIVENMPGAGMKIAANHVYKAAKPDGLTIGHFTGSQSISQMLGQPGSAGWGHVYRFLILRSSSLSDLACDPVGRSRTCRIALPAAL